MTVRCVDVETNFRLSESQVLKVFSDVILFIQEGFENFLQLHGQLLKERAELDPSAIRSNGALC